MIDLVLERIHTRIQELKDQLVDPTLDRDMYEFSEEFITHLLHLNETLLAHLSSKGH